MYLQDPKTADLVKHVLPRNESRHWGSVIIHPENVHFAFQQKSERVYILTRKHFITNLGWILRVIFFMFLPIIILLIWNLLLPESFTSYIANGALTKEISPFAIVGIVLLYYSFIFTYARNSFIIWYHNVYMITNQRMIHIQFRLMTGTRLLEAPLENIVDISQENYGFFPSLFNYGNVKVQTATAVKSRFDFRQIPDPSWFRSILSELVKINTEGEP